MRQSARNSRTVLSLSLIMEKTDYVIDIQAFHDKNGNFLPKEIAVLGIDCNFIAHWIIKPPSYDCDIIQKGILATNTYLSCYHHGIEWFDGEADLDRVYKVLREVASNALRIYVRGAQKQKLLENVLGRHIINLEEFNCPSLKNLPRVNEHYCFFHGRKREYFTCALGYVYKLRLWIMKTLHVPVEVHTNTQQQRSKDVPDSKKKYTGLDKIDETCEKLKNLNISVESTSPVTPATTTTVSASSVEYRPAEEHHYDNVDDEFSTDSTRTQKHNSDDSGCFPSRPNSLRPGEAVCNCG